jgi:hypothetical protein
MNVARDTHFQTHPWKLGDDPKTFPRYPSMSDDQQLSTGAASLELPVQGATIFGDGVAGIAPAHGATIFSVAQSAMTHAAQTISSAAAVPSAPHTAAGPIVFPVVVHDATPTQWRIYNRWTGKYVSGTNGGEHADEARAFAFPSEVAAVQFAQQSQGTSLATALAQPPPDDPPNCNKCWRAQVRGATQCLHCRSPLQVTTSWAYVFPCNAAGQLIGGSVSL